MKLLAIFLIILLLTTNVFAITQNEINNFFVGNQLRKPLLLGSYNTGIIVTKDNPINDYWYVCFPIKNNPNYNYSCNICRSCN